MTRSSRLGRAAAATGVLALGLLVSQGPSGAASRPPSVFATSVVAAPVVDKLAVITVLPLPFDNGVARSSVSMNSQPLVISQAAVAYAPVAETVAAGQPPEVTGAAWCFSYFPSGPGNPAEARCGGGGVLPGGLPVEAGSGHTVTTGDEDDPTTLQSQSSAKATGIGGAGAPAPVSMGSASSSAESKAVEDRMTAAGSTEVTDVDVAGVLAIRSVSSFVSGALSGEPGGAAVARDLAVEGASVAGQPVEIDESGVHAVGQPAVPLLGEDQDDQINAVLGAAGINVFVVPSAEPEISADGTTLRASSGSLRIEFNNLESGILSGYDIGAVSVVMQASQVTEAAPVPDVLGVDGGSTVVSPLAAPPVSGGGDGAPGDSSEAAAPPPPPAPGAGAGTPSREASLVAVEPVSDVWDLPYPSYALLVLAFPMLLTIRRFSITRR